MSGLLVVFRTELRRIVSVQPAFAVLVGAVLIYAALYPQPYLAEALRDVPVAIVDQDRTTSSRDFIRRIDATETVAVTADLPDLASAERAVHGRHVYGIVLIPRNFERDLLRGQAAPVALYADASYFLMYQRIAAGVVAVARSLGAEIETARLVASGIDARLAAAAADPVPLTAVPLFNPQSGYATYLLPAAFVLILQQTLLMGIGLLGTLRNEPAAAAHYAGALPTVLGKTLAYLTLHAVLLPLYLIALPSLYGLPRVGNAGDMLMFALPFVLAVSLLGLAATALFRRPETVQLVFVGLGIPVFFLAGFAWPASAIPPTINALAQLVPSTPAIDGFIRIGQMGASLSDVGAQLANLWALVLLYGALALAAEFHAQSREKPDARQCESLPPSIRP